MNMKVLHTLAGCLALTSITANALEIAPGDYEPIPAGMNALMLYYQHADRSSVYANGHELSDNFKLKSDISLLRFIHSVGLSNNVVIQPQFILPFGSLRTSGAASALGDASGIGDLILGAPVLVKLDTANRDIFSFGPYLYLPTGQYDKEDGLNLGENRSRLTLQAGYIHHFSDRWALDTAADVSWFSHNNDYGAEGVTLKQRRRYEYQGYVRYQWTEKTTIGLGGGIIKGGRTKVDDVDQHDGQDTSYARLTATHFIEPTLQFQVQLGKDLQVEQGAKEEARLNLRLVKLF